jgi:hypothetical protein
MRTFRSLLPLLALLLAFVVGMVVLFQLRLGAGDLFPRYSSHRADPLGTRLLHDSLAQQPGLRVERNLERIEKLGTRPGRTLVMAGMTPQRWAAQGADSVNALDAAVRSGARLVVLFEASMVYEKARRLPDMKRREGHSGSAPTDTKPAARPGEERRGRNEIGVRKPEAGPEASPQAGEPADAATEGKTGPAAEKGGGKPGRKPGKARPPHEGSEDDDDEGEPGVDGKPAEFSPEAFARRVNTLDLIERLWGVQLYGRWIMQSEEGAVREGGAPADFPGRLPWKSCSYFELSKGSPWNVLYTRGTLPVLVEMRHGAGSIVLASDAHVVSNEALQEKPALGLLSWLVGSSDTVVFDEVHLGLSKDKGLASLARRYGLVPAMLLLVLAGLLYVWRQTVRFIPPPEEREELVLEFHPTAGLEALLRRAVPSSRLYETCLAEWRRHARPTDQARLSSLPVGRGAQAYNAALAALRRRMPGTPFKQDKTP